MARPCVGHLVHTVVLSFLNKIFKFFKLYRFLDVDWRINKQTNKQCLRDGAGTDLSPRPPGSFLGVRNSTVPGSRPATPLRKNMHCSAYGRTHISSLFSGSPTGKPVHRQLARWSTVARTSRLPTGSSATHCGRSSTLHHYDLDSSGQAKLGLVHSACSFHARNALGQRYGISRWF